MSADTYQVEKNIADIDEFVADASVDIGIGSLMYLDTDDAKPASSQADQLTEPLNQALFASKFLGVAVSARHSPSYTAAGVVRVKTRGLWEFACQSSTFEYGDFVGASEAASGTALEDIVVEKVLDESLAIGRVRKRYSGATTKVWVELVSRYRAPAITNSVVNLTAATATLTAAEHGGVGRTIVFDRAAGIAATLPAAQAGLIFNFIVKTTFAGAASIKSVVGTDIMIGHALMGNNSDNTVVDWPSIAATTNDTIDLFGTANSTGGIEGQTITIKGLAAGVWHVAIRGDAAGTEATPFANTVV